MTADFSFPNSQTLAAYRSYVNSAPSVNDDYGYGHTSGTNGIADRLESVTNTLNAAVTFSPGSGTDADEV